MSAAVWADDRNGPRERARAETLSQGLGGGVSPEFLGPGKYVSAPGCADGAASICG